MSHSPPPEEAAARWQRLEEAFAAALPLPPAERLALLAELEAQDASLAAEVRDMLAAADGQQTAFERPELAPEMVPTAADKERVGEVIGPFRLVSLLGHGGMGEVYLAERVEGFEQQVAIKLLKAAMGGTIFAQRFLRERATLARLNHPHIASLVDGGTTADGSPWLAMEHVDGLNLLDYCEQHGLDLRARVRLMLEVCEAVQFAHQHLVIHRDLKPGNILVRADGHAVLLDFGIAKLLEEEASSQVELTLPQAPLYTPAYASPEQMRGEAVGTTSDVYSLGVILYRLFSGHLPFVEEGHTRFEWTQLVSEQLPPSIRREQPRFPADLEAIVQKCLRKESERRYPTVQALLEDLQRWLRGLPVQAQPDAFWYRTRRFLQRNRLPVGLAAATLLASAIGLGAWFKQSQVAARKGLTASRVSEFLIDFFGHPDPWARGLEDMSMADFFRTDLDALFADLDQEPEVQRDLAAALGRVLLNLGEEDRAIVLLTRAHEASLRGRLEDPVADADLLFDLGVAQRRAGLLKEAEASLRECLSLRQRHFGEQHEEVASAWNTLGLVHHTMGDFALAEQEYRKALAMREALHGRDGLPLASTLNNLGALALAQEDMAEAIADFERARQIQEQAFAGADHPDLATTLNNLGMAWQLAGDLEQAEDLYRQALAMRRRVLPADHPHLAGSLNNLGLIEEERGRQQEAAKLFQEALSLAEAKAPPGHPLLEQIRENLQAVSE